MSSNKRFSIDSIRSMFNPDRIGFKFSNRPSSYPSGPDAPKRTPEEAFFETFGKPGQTSSRVRSGPPRQLIMKSHFVGDVPVSWLNDGLRKSVVDPVKFGPPAGRGDFCTGNKVEEVTGTEDAVKSQSKAITTQVPKGVSESEPTILPQSQIEARVHVEAAAEGVTHFQAVKQPKALSDVKVVADSILAPINISELISQAEQAVSQLETLIGSPPGHSSSSSHPVAISTPKVNASEGSETKWKAPWLRWEPKPIPTTGTPRCISFTPLPINKPETMAEKMLRDADKEFASFILFNERSDLWTRVVRSTKPKSIQNFIPPSPQESGLACTSPAEPHFGPNHAKQRFLDRLEHKTFCSSRQPMPFTTSASSSFRTKATRSKTKRRAPPAPSVISPLVRKGRAVLGQIYGAYNLSKETATRPSTIRADPHPEATSGAQIKETRPSTSAVARVLEKRQGCVFSAEVAQELQEFFPERPTLTADSLQGI